MNSKDEKTLPLGLQMLGPGLMVLGVMLPWGASPEAQGLDRWGFMVLLVGVPALLLPWAARETVMAHRVLGGLALIAAIGALGGWMAAWQAIPADIPDPATRVGKGPLFTLAGAALTWATLPGPLRGWHRALAAGGGFGLMLAIAVGMSAWLSAEKETAAAMGSPVPARMGTPWIIIEVHPSPETSTMRRMEQPSLAMPTSTPPPFPQGTSLEPGGLSPRGLPTATPWGEGPESSLPTPAPTATVLPPHSPLPTPTPPSSPLNP
ncbi:hypothetical protein [Thermoflexus sp.]|uniref:hypothetical protein n=1 Tax=Thermoflexus sp. TaxID=1969742 RepID=UPI00260FDED6|nr:hypothetical protein [Thermoflexus sp.]MDW8065852.1 hypothetical protein [Anaerolineae bacterium]